MFFKSGEARAAPAIAPCGERMKNRRERSLYPHPVRGGVGRNAKTGPRQVPFFRVRMESGPPEA